jgi:hypothetical protein
MMGFHHTAWKSAEEDPGFRRGDGFFCCLLNQFPLVATIDCIGLLLFMARLLRGHLKIFSLALGLLLWIPALRVLITSK